MPTASRRSAPGFRLPTVLAGMAWLALMAPTVLGQGSRADYQRALSLAERTEDRVLRAGVHPHWQPGATSFWYSVRIGPDALEYVTVDCVRGTRVSSTTPPEAIQPLEAKRGPEAPKRSARTGEATQLTFVNQTADSLDLYWLSETGERKAYGRVRPGTNRVQPTYAGHVWLLTNPLGQTLATFEATAEASRAIVTESTEPAPTASPSPSPDPGTSPDGRWIAFVRDSNIWIRSKDGQEPVALSRDGAPGDAYAADIRWAPDSSAFVARRVQAGATREVTTIEAAPRDQLQPKVHTQNYLKPGDPLPKPRLRLFTVANRHQFDIDDTAYPIPFTEDGDLDLRWAPDSRTFYFNYNQRGHQVYRILAVSGWAMTEPFPARPLQPRVVVEETARTFIDWTNKTWRHWLDGSQELLWMSERDGWAHLWLVDTASGQVKRQITHGEWVVREVVHVDEAKREVWFLAGGARPDQDPYFLHLARASLDGGDITLLTEGNGTHHIEFSPDRRWFLDTWSRVDQAPITELRNSRDGSRVLELERGDASALVAAGWTWPEPFVAPGRDGKTPMYGILIKPSNFDPAKSYPVIEEIYAGPHGAFVPKEFGRLIRQHALAELGFIVVQVDGQGTNHRGKRFQDVAWKNLADSGLPDHIAWLRAAAATRPWMDLNRVGIYGGSAGGQSSTRALLDHGDFYRVAVSDCGCHDNRMDKIWWNEQWLGWPIDESYVRSSNVADAAKLQGNLLLIVGELDTNVDPASTYQLAAALVRADKDFELLIMPGSDHGAAENPYGIRRRMDFFVRHLWNRVPRWE